MRDPSRLYVTRKLLSTQFHTLPNVIKSEMHNSTLIQDEELLNQGINIVLQS